uniref:heavy-metal-associated domain-containing protein n=1 Tax=Flavobacterium sp. TaxID=239 RepID=UPI00404A6C51
MKNIVLIALVSFLSFSGFSQEKKSKNKTVEFEVSGNCEMCKKRIEKAAFSVKGVKSADWHIQHKDIRLIIDETKCSEKEVAKAIALAGHDNKHYNTTDELFQELHGCCQYEREK